MLPFVLQNYSQSLMELTQGMMYNQATGHNAYGICSLSPAYYAGDCGSRCDLASSLRRIYREELPDCPAGKQRKASRSM